MKKNEIALTLYTVRDFCQTEKDLLNTLKKTKKVATFTLKLRVKEM